jgi:hypothetical protein
MPIRTITIGTKVLKTELEFIRQEGDEFDTEVRVEGLHTLCWISATDIDKFAEDLQALITKYAI